jgi:hypothetical protein
MSGAAKAAEAAMLLQNFGGDKLQLVNKSEIC